MSSEEVPGAGLLGTLLPLKSVQLYAVCEGESRTDTIQLVFSKGDGWPPCGR